jgi:hypothetical protein
MQKSAIRERVSSDAEQQQEAIQHWGRDTERRVAGEWTKIEIGAGLIKVPCFRQSGLAFFSSAQLL